MSDYRDPNDPMYKNRRNEPADRTGTSWAELPGRVFLVIVLGLAFGVGHEPSRVVEQHHASADHGTGGALYDARLDPTAVASSQSAIRHCDALERPPTSAPFVVTSRKTGTTISRQTGIVGQGHQHGDDGRGFRRI